MERLEMVMLEIREISYTYDNAKKAALQSISFELDRGEIVGLVGHNGAGKSTLLECISGLKWPQSGKIIINEKEYGISFVPNDLFLYNMLTIKETLYFIGSLHSLSRIEIDKVIKPLLRLFSLNSKENDYMKDLSYGMKQQVALIIGILSKPTYFLLDEPMNGFDALSTKKTKDYLTSLAKEKEIGILLSSHRLDIIEDICDRVVILNTGRLVYEGTVSQLKNNQTFEDALISVSGDKHADNF
ncbi:ABC transporter ATP-binding protein [Heyndrickxia acidiproducens]|uniref:ABC transporter ATP-binding protein n=1 Tax=Heyndrickxia acidiproducens TaxID=1121084 RepID=UPI00035D6548|nr:ABC transporter ATP-binding protein [Heyndrickxia acidiproducens]